MGVHRRNESATPNFWTLEKFQARLAGANYLVLKPPPKKPIKYSLIDDGSKWRGGDDTRDTGY